MVVMEIFLAIALGFGYVAKRYARLAGDTFVAAMALLGVVEFGLVLWLAGELWNIIALGLGYWDVNALAIQTSILLAVIARWMFRIVSCNRALR